MSVLAWSHGVFAVQPLAGMIAQGAFLLPDGRQVSPFFVAPWWNEQPKVPMDGLTTGLRGEWPCVPFGYPMPRDLFPARWQAVMDDADSYDDVHGFGSNHDWDVAPMDDGLLLSIDYPATHDVARLERRLTPVADSPAIDFALTIHPRRDCRLPVSLHACFTLPETPGAARIIPGGYRCGWTFPAVIEPGATLFAKDAVFDNLSAVPVIGGGTIDATNLPLRDAVEELVQLTGAEGRMALDNHAGGYRATIEWDAAILPGVVLWYSNLGRKGEPWRGRTRCIGIEPAAAAFGLSPRTSGLPNPVSEAGAPTAVPLKAGEPLTICYRIGVSAL